MILFNGQILSTEKESLKDNIIKFEQLNIDLKNLESDIIKVPKLQETKTISLLKCVLNLDKNPIKYCKENTKKEMTTVLNRRIVLPFYIPIIALICSFLLIKPKSKKNYFINKYTIFFLGFLILLYAELIIRFTGVSKIISTVFLLSPFALMPIIYFLLTFSIARESLSK